MGQGDAATEMQAELQPLGPSLKQDWAQRARWVSWQLGAVLLFILLGAGQALAARASVAPDGSLPYDTSAAVAWAEATKLVIAIGWVICMDRHSLVWPPPRDWVFECADLFVIAILFSVTNELNFLIVERLGAGLFMLLGNLKIVFTCLFMSTLLHKRFAPLQWVAVAMLTTSAIVVKAPAMAGVSHERLSPGAALGFALILASTASSGLASVKNELILKRDGQGPPMPFMAKNAVLYFWGLGLNLASWGIWGRHSLVGSFNSAAVVSMVCLVGLGLACAVILRYLDNVVRCFSSVGQVLLTVALSQLLPARLHEGSFGACYALALVLLSAALVLYQAHDSQSLPQYMAIAVSCSLTVSVACATLEKYAASTPS